MMFGVVLVGTYTSVFIASPILIYLGVGSTRLHAQGGDEPEPEAEPAPPVQPAAKPTAKPARARR
jgi:preprotein translocase subunit SecF